MLYYVYINSGDANQFVLEKCQLSSFREFILYDIYFYIFKTVTHTLVV